MRPEFSEFSFGFAFTEELIRRVGPIQAAPIFPTLREEAIRGYDLHIVGRRGISWFLQYKLSDRLVRGNSTYWDTYCGPYFRIDITPRPRSKQHNLLRALSDSGEPNVFYAAPRFYRMSEFNRAYLAREVCRRSLLVPLRNLPHLTDDEAHCVSFTGPMDLAWHTDDENRQGLLIKGIFSFEEAYGGTLSDFSADTAQTMDAAYFTRLRNTLRSVLADGLEEEPGSVSTSGTIDQLSDDPLAPIMWDIRYWLTTYLNLEMIVFWEDS